MKYTETCIALVKEYEGLYLHAYRCSSDVLTIGYGHTKDVHINMVITVEQAEKFLKEDLDEALKYVEYYCKKYNIVLSQCQTDALVSFTFNCGCGNLQKVLIYAEKINDIPAQMGKYIYNKYGKMLEGLRKRRQAEIDLFNSGGINNMFKTIKYGDENTLVKIYQTVRGLKSDGIFGKQTLKDVKDFQMANNLIVDGIVGIKTWDCLLKKWYR